MEVVVINQEEIKPSSPTPDSLKTYHHSVFDQVVPNLYPFAPVILFYTERIDPDLLKRSLSETIPRFYPLAGKVKDERSIDCDDEGALFTTARVNRSLSDFLSKPDLSLLQHLLPRDLPREISPGTRVTHIQLNTFDCGGTALAVCVMHRFLDGATVGTFLKGWSGITLGKESAVIPDYSVPSLFPRSADLWLKDSTAEVWRLFMRTGKSITKRFVFDSLAISALKDLARSSALENPTRVEAVSAFLWKHMRAVSWKLKGGEKIESSVLVHAVNLRKRMIPPLPATSLGNVVWLTPAVHKNDEHSDDPLPRMASEVRRSIRVVSDDFVRNLTVDSIKSKGIQSHLETQETASQSDASSRFLCSSWCGFGYYEADFGQGNPVWISTAVKTRGLEIFSSSLVLYDTRHGDGIEAWITLDEKEMEMLEEEEEMSRYAISNPNPLL